MAITLCLVIEDGMAAGLKEIINLKVPFAIYSSPAELTDEKQEPRAFAFVRHEQEKNGDHFFSVDAYGSNGKQLKGFPVLRAKQLLVAPGEQIGVDQMNRWVVIDSQGKFNRLEPNGKLVFAKKGNPLHSMLTHPPTYVTKGHQRGYVLISRDLQPFTQSQNGIDIVDDSGASRPGFPIKFKEWPAKHAPLIDETNGRVYVLMQSGSIDGFDWIAGQRLTGFPVFPEWRHKGPVATSMSFLIAPKMIVIANNTNTLTYVNLEAKTSTMMQVKGAAKLSAVTSSGDGIITIDDGQNKIYQLDAAANIKHTAALELKDRVTTYALFATSTSSIGTYSVVSVAYNPGDPNAAFNALFEKHATSEDRAEEARLIERYKTRTFNGEPATPAQREELVKTINYLRANILFDKFGPHNTSKEMDPYMIAQTVVQIFTVDTKGIRAEKSEVIRDYVPDTQFSGTGRVTPLFQIDRANQRAFLFIPLNAQESESSKVRGGLLRGYRWDIK